MAGCGQHEPKAGFSGLGGIYPRSGGPMTGDPNVSGIAQTQLAGLTPEMQRVLQILTDDLFQCTTANLHGEKKHFWRRVFIRGLFAMVEGVTSLSRAY